MTRRKPQLQRKTEYCDQCGDFHAAPCPSPAQLAERRDTEQTAWSAEERLRRTVQKSAPGEVYYEAGNGKGRRVERREVQGR